MKKSFSPYSLIAYTIIFFLSSESTSVYGQYEVKPKTNNLYWIHAGLGSSSLGSLGASAGLGIQLNNLILSLRGTANAENYLAIFSGGDEFFDVGLLVGIGARKQKVHASFSVGIARVTGSRYISGERVDIDIDPTIGFPIEVQLFHKAFRSSAIGLNFYWNINREKSFGGFTFGFMFGKLR